MVTKSFLAKLVAKPGLEDTVAEFLEGALALAEQEPGTTAWFAVRAAASTFYIFDVFPSEEERTWHIEGPIAEALMANADRLLAQPPEIIPADVLAAKLAG